MSSVEKVTIALTSEMASCVRGAVSSGEYVSTSEAIRHAVREWQERRELLGYTVAELQTLVQDGLASGRSSRASVQEVKLDARRRLEAASRRD